MAQFGWAYIDCDDTGGGGQAAGPTGSVQFLTGSNATSGSANFIFMTASNTLFVTGTLLVSGTISASSFIVNQTDTISGSTIFGNDNNDTHQLTGSLFVGDTTTLNTFSVLPATSQSVTLGMRHSYKSIAASGFTSSTGDYIIGIGGSGDVEFRLHSASVHGSGAILVIKDELSGTMPAISLYSNGAHWFVF